MDYLLGIDVGTTNTKAVLYDLEGQMRAVASAPTPVTEEGAGRATHDPEALYETTVAVIRRAVAQVEDSSLVRGLAISSMAESGVPLDAQGRVLYPVIVWHDTRTIPYEAWWQERISDERLFAITGAQPGHIFSLNKILWLRDHEPEAYRRLSRWLSVSDYLAYRLAGVPAMSYPQACRTLAFDLHTADWSPDLLDIAGVPAGLFPPALPSGQALGPLRPEAAAACGLSPRTLVSVGGHDHICASVASGVIAPGAMLVSSGTVEAVLAVLDQPRTGPEVHALGISCGMHAMPGRYYLIGGILGVGPLLNWVVQVLLQQPLNDEGYRALTEAAQASPRGAQGLYLLPFFSGAGAPRRAPRATGAYLGLRLHHTREDMVRAVLEGLCYELRHMLESFYPLMPARETLLRVVGGGARNALWLQMRADVTGRTVETPQGAERAALGAALLAGLGAGLYDSLEAAAMSAYRAEQTYRPDPEAHRDYSARYEGVYRGLYPAGQIVLAKEG